MFYAGSSATAAPGDVGIVDIDTTMIVAPATGHDIQIEPIRRAGLVGFTDPLAGRTQPRRRP